MSAIYCIPFCEMKKKLHKIKNKFIVIIYGDVI